MNCFVMREKVCTFVEITRLSMKKLASIVCLTAVVLGLTGCRSQRCSSPVMGSDYKSIIRLWQVHHEDEGVCDELIEAFRRYPKACDEVWFCTPDPTSVSLDVHRESARKMGVMAERLRAIGIVPSMQAITVGHPEAGATDPNALMTWGPLVGPGGERAVRECCPRQQEFLRVIEETMAVYCEAVHPRVVWLDDDLRLTQRAPAMHSCYCDSCLALFNRRHGYSYDRASLVNALALNSYDGGLRHAWIDFCQEGLACVAEAAARGVHRASPETVMGLQHVNFHASMLEGYDWNRIFDAFERVTGHVPCSRPGHGYYNDHEPRGMIVKGLDMARQMRRLNGNITEIAPEIEGYLHRASGKSGHGLCVETMLYLAMGATEMSYAIICGNEEPMEWYATHYFKQLDRWHDFARDYACFNRGTEPGGIDPYLSRELNYCLPSPPENALAWGNTSSGGQIYELAALGFPFCPDGHFPALLMLDEAGVGGMRDGELQQLLAENNVVVNGATWGLLSQRGLTAGLQRAAMPEDLRDVAGYSLPNGHRLVVCEYGIEYIGMSGAERLRRLHAMDWASQGRLPAVLESTAQAVVVPRIDGEGNLRSVALLNCTISEEECYTLRLRLGPSQQPRRFVWKKNGVRDQVLSARREGSDVIVEVPALEGWNFGWIAVD